MHLESVHAVYVQTIALAVVPADGDAMSHIVPLETGIPPGIEPSMLAIVATAYVLSPLKLIDVMYPTKLSMIRCTFSSLLANLTRYETRW